MLVGITRSPELEAVLSNILLDELVEVADNVSENIGVSKALDEFNE